MYCFQRDRLGELLEFLPGIVSVDVLSSVREGTRLVTCKRWTGSQGAIPDWAMAAFPPTVLQWRDDATWDDVTRTVDWASDLDLFPGAMIAKGRTRYEDDGDETIVQIDGELSIVAERVTGVPTALVRPLLPAIERLLVAQVKTNLRLTLDAIARRLSEGS